MITRFPKTRHRITAQRARVPAELPPPAVEPASQARPIKRHGEFRFEVHPAALDAALHAIWFGEFFGDMHGTDDCGQLCANFFTNVEPRHPAGAAVISNSYHPTVGRGLALSA
jgi:hypothetical protein